MIATAVEYWLAIPGFEGQYEVSDTGRVRSLDRIDSAGRRLRGQAMKGGRHTNGYPNICLCKEGRPTTLSIHRLVLRAFVGEPTSGQVVRHLNGIPTDNRLTNLCWGTPSENESDKLRHGTNPHAAKTHCPSGHEYAGENLFYNKRGARFCRACSRARSRWQRAQRRVAELDNPETPDPADELPVA